MRITIEAKKCISAGQCVLVAPEVFDQDDEGIVELLQESPEPHLRQAVREAAELCPAQLIELHE